MANSLDLPRSQPNRVGPLRAVLGVGRLYKVHEVHDPSIGESLRLIVVAGANGDMGGQGQMLHLAVYA